MILLYGDLKLSHLDEKSWRRPNVTGLIRRTRVHHFKPRRPQLNYDPAQPDQLTIQLHNGDRWDATCDYPLGSPQRPMSEQAILGKFIDNAGLQGLQATLPVQRLLSSLAHWTQCEDLHPLIDAVESLRPAANHSTDGTPA